ncbi:hypothetical protein RYZ26_09355 [Terasakiella sp. A23]|uniref:O-antigen ligase family protein n=1 Tax=Terasakiella sp. FCG-A23 TaxID=3080561 RepID=UPI0029557F35|nr:hypothetical protein [Terasakiella sp. A23]MDV7339798.1 hypothetical protein [Terasakiella sp. A23]
MVSLNPQIQDKLLSIAAICVGLSVPSILFGRAFIGGLLLLALLLVLILTNHKKELSALHNQLPKRFIAFLGCVIIASAVNIPFSLRVDLSLEAWGRTWLILLLTSYVFFVLREKLDIITYSAFYGVAFAIFYLYIKREIDHTNHPSKPTLNAYLLLLPICAYISFTNKKISPKIISLMIIWIFIWFLNKYLVKATMAGLILMVTSSIFLISIVKFKLRTVIASFGLLLACVTTGLLLWLPDTVNQSSVVNKGITIIPVWALDLHRQFIWAFSFERIIESPWVGYGLNASNYHPLANQTIQEYFGDSFNIVAGIASAPVLPAHPHNWIIELQLDSGLIGFLPFLTLVTFIFTCSLKRFWQKPNPELLGFIAVNIGYWGTGLLNFSYWSSWWQASYFVSAGIFLMLYFRRRNII